MNARWREPTRREDGTDSFPDRRARYNDATAGRMGHESAGDRLTTFVCECGRLGCNGVVDLTLREYAAVRAAPKQFVITTEHQAHGDRVVAGGHGYVIVTKLTEGRPHNSVNNS